MMILITIDYLLLILPAWKVKKRLMSIVCRDHKDMRLIQIKLEILYRFKVQLIMLQKMIH